MVGRVRLTMTITNVLVVAIVVVALLFAAFFVARRIITQNADKELINIAESVQRRTGQPGFSIPTGGRQFPLGPFRSNQFNSFDSIDLRDLSRRDPPLEFAVFDSSGAGMIAFTDVLAPLPVEADVQRALAGDQQISTVSSDAGSVRVVTQPIIDSDGLVIAVVQVAESRAAQDQIVNTLRNVLLAVGGAGLLFAAGAGYLLTGRTMRPVNLAFERQKAFVADAAHEFRTPLAIISANAEAMEMQGVDMQESDRELLKGIQTESSYLAALITKLLEMAKLDFDDRQAATGSVDLTATVNDACAAVSTLAAARGISLTSPAVTGPLHIKGDAVLVRLIILSLLDNAIKYNTENGTVSVEIEASEHSAAVRIRDTGPGIPQEHLERVFDRFYRVDRARSRQTGGAGLGLAIARRAAEALHGQLELTSSPDSGTVATIRFQLGNA